MLAIIGASGKLAFATLQALLNHNLVLAKDIICTTRSKPNSLNWSKLSSLGVKVKTADFDDADSLKNALDGCTALYLVSTPQIELDFNNAPHGEGREKHHLIAIDIAREVGIKHIYYTSLAFQRPSKAGVMVAHIRTEEYLESLTDGTKYTIIREGLYNESWPLYLGYYDVPRDNRDSITVAGDGPISWTSIADMGLGSALIISAPSDTYASKTMYMSTARNVKTLQEIAQLVGTARGKGLDLNVVSKDEHMRFYTREKGMPVDAVEWWVSSYAALKDKECLISDDTLDKLLKSKDVTPKTMEETIQEMMAA